MVLPMRISVAVTPGRSWARAMAGAASVAAPAASRWRRVSSILVSPWCSDIRAFDQAAEADPGCAVPALELHLLDRPVVLRAGIQGDPGQQHRDRHVLEAGGLPHHVLAREIAVALREKLLQGAAQRVAVNDVAVVRVGLRHPLLDEAAQLVHARIVAPGGIALVLQVAGRDDADALLDARRLHD